MASDYDEILNKQWDEIPDDVILPDGQYLLRVQRGAYIAPKGDNSAKVLFFMSVQEPLDDVDTDALNALGDDFDITQNEVVYTVWVEKNRDWKKVARFIDLLGVDTAGKSILDTLKTGVVGASIVGRLGVRTFENRDGTTGTENSVSDFSAVA